MPETVFLLATLLSVRFFYVGTGKDKRVLAISLFWTLLIGGIAATGFFKEVTATPPRFLLVLLGGVALSGYLIATIRTARVNANSLLLVHAARVAVEMVLYQLGLNGELPMSMTFEGCNYDLLVGLSALALYFYGWVSGKKPDRRLLILWNGYGILSLTLIVTIAILSAPLPIQQLAFDRPNVAVLRFPFVLLPAYLVPLVFASHILALKTLRTSAQDTGKKGLGT